MLGISFYVAVSLRNDNPQIVLETIQIQRQQPQQTLVASKNIEISDNKNQLASAVAVSRTVAKQAPVTTKPAAVVPTAVKPIAAKPVAVVNTPATSATAAVQAGSTEEVTFKRKNTGVYRGIVEVTDLEAVTERVKSKILSLSGFKAGEVELGWMKSTDTTYFHFIIPTENTEDLNQFIRQFGDYKFRFEKHPRVLNNDQKRFIIEVRKVE